MIRSDDDGEEKADVPTSCPEAEGSAARKGSREARGGQTGRSPCVECTSSHPGAASGHELDDKWLTAHSGEGHWQLVVNTGTTVVTFLMAFLIQSTQSRDSEAIQVKLDELLRATEGAHSARLGLEEMEEADLNLIRRRYIQLVRRAREQLRSGGRAWAAAPNGRGPECVARASFGRA